MNEQLQGGMGEAMRLMQQGQLTEATAAIQRALGGGGPMPTSSPPGGFDGPGGLLEEIGRGLNGALRSPAVPETGTDGNALRRVPKPPRDYRGVARQPGAAPAQKQEILMPADVSGGGRFVERSYADGAGSRGYKLYVPSGYVGQSVPLIVMLHGCTQNPDDFAVGTRMNTLAEAHTFLVAYPAQAGGANMQKCWNWFQASDQQRGRGEPALIAGITRQVVEEYEVDAGRVYVTGMSSGGAMAAIMAETYPELYAAVGVHSGLAPGAARDLPSAFAAMQGGSPGNPNGGSGRVVPAIVFHGDRDSTVHPRNADHLLTHWASPDVAASPAIARRGRVPGGHEYTRAVVHAEGDRSILERWTVHGLGHAWSGGSLPGSYTDPKGPDASAEMVRFFEQHELPEL